MTITKIAYDDLGKAEFGWLKARHHFSFGRYHNPKRMGFGTLRVINDDIIQPGTGFDPHPHEDMEIITYVRKGAITHLDKLGNEGRTAAGDVQVMSAGTGIVHAEYNREKEEETQLYQIWILPGKHGVKPRWEQKKFPKDPVKDALHLIVSGNADDAETGALFIHQNATIHAGRITAGTSLNHTVKQMGYVLFSEGEIELNGTIFTRGDAAEVPEGGTLHITANTDTELLVIDVPA